MVSKEDVLTLVFGALAFVIFILLIIFVFPPEWQEFLLDERYFWAFVIIIMILFFAIVYGIRKLISRS